MTTDNHSIAGTDGVLQQVIADYLLAEASGRPIERNQLLERHPELAAELQSFFADNDRARAWAEPLCVAAPVTPALAGDAATIDASQGAPKVSVVSTGRAFGDYEILSEIARGGMGIVFKARQVRLNRVVALKMILTGQLAGAANIQRFHSEAQAAAHLDHPNIVPIYEVGVHDEQHFFSMKLVEGGNLSSFSRDPKGSARLLAIVARAVHYAHQRGILHRDLKPANILLDPAGQPLVTDFGLAKRLTDGSAVTQSGSIVGTPSYMAPEQARGLTNLSTAVDVYSLGAILFELLTGQPPFRGESALEVMRQVIDHEPPWPRSLNSHVDRDLEIICLKCLEKDPQRRYGSAEALAEDMERWLANEPIHARAATAREQVTKWAKRRPAVAGLIGVSVIAPIVTLIVGLIYNAQLKLEIGKANELTTKLGAEEMKAKHATAQAKKDAEQAGEANQQAQEAKKRADDLVQQAEGLRLIAESRVVLPDNPGLALLLALEGADRGRRSASHNNALAAVLTACRERGPVLRNDDKLAPLSAAFFPDGKRVLTTNVNSIRIWDRNTGKLFTRWSTPLNITSTSISPDGRYVAATCQDYWFGIYSDGRRIVHTDRVAHLWDTTTNKETVLRGHEHRVVSVRFSPDSKRVLTASWDYTARIWDAASGKVIHILKGHTISLHSAVFSADSKTVFTASSGVDKPPFPVDKEAGDLKEATGVDLPIPTDAKMVGGHASATGESRHLKAGGDIARIWDAETGKELKVIPAPQKDWSFLAAPGATMSPDGKHVAAVDRATANLFDVQSGKWTPLFTFLGDKNNYGAFQPAFSEDGKFLLTNDAPDRRGIRIWNTTTGELAGSIRGEESIHTARFLNQNRIITISYDKICRLWSYDPASAKVNARELMALKGHEMFVGTADLSPDGNTVLTASADGTARFWNVGRNQALDRVLAADGNPTSAPGEQARCAAASPDGKFIATGSLEGKVRLWDVKTGQRLAEWQGHANRGANPKGKDLCGEVTGMSFSTDGKKLLTVSADPVCYLQDRQAKNKMLISPYTPVRIWDVEIGKELALQGGHEAGVYSASFSPDGKRVVTIADTGQAVKLFDDKFRAATDSSGPNKDRSARVWDSTSGKELFVVQGKWRVIGTAVWNHDGTRIATTHEDGVRIWNAVDGTALTLIAPKRWITSVRFSPDGRRVLTWQEVGAAFRGGHWGEIQNIARANLRADLWYAATGQHLATLKGHDAPINSAAFSADGQRIVTTAEDVTSWGYFPATGQHGRGEDGSFKDRTARIWDAATGKPLQVLRGHLRSVHSASFSRDGKFLVTTSEDRTARIWDVATGKEFFTLKGHGDAVKSAEFTADGQCVVTTSWDGTPRVWPADPLSLARERRPRDLSAEERERFEIDPPGK